MAKKFGTVKMGQNHKMPSTEKILIVRPMVDSKKISAEEQKVFCLELGCYDIS